MYWSGHLAVAYLCYVIVQHLGGWPQPDWRVSAGIVAGAIFPDLIDKPLAWELGVLASGRSLMHTLFAVVPVSIIVILVSWRYGRRDVGAAFAIAYFSHPFADAYQTILADGTTSFLFWPLAPRQLWAGGVVVPIESRTVESMFILIAGVSVLIQLSVRRRHGSVE